MRGSYWRLLKWLRVENVFSFVQTIGEMLLSRSRFCSEVVDLRANSLFSTNVFPTLDGITQHSAMTHEWWRKSRYNCEKTEAAQLKTSSDLWWDTLLIPFMRRGNDAFGVLPTGFFKILIYKVAGLLQEEIGGDRNVVTKALCNTRTDRDHILPRSSKQRYIWIDLYMTLIP